MSEKPPVAVTTNPDLRHFREYVAAAIAVIVVLGTVVMLITALRYVNSSDQFTRVKDLLLIINPLLGVVIGYYFNKVSTEARAESAEATAQSAALNAQQASEARNSAETEAQTAKTEAEEAMSTLSAVSQAAEKVLSQAPAPAPGMLKAGDEGLPVEDARLELQVALARAKRIIG
ncbi:MAG: hypothetical protein U9R05_09390 [Chloroflexota bacterium]|nr:hypothetical protein [Chloroflexota bacterium]